jgi:DNA-binding CsgD family transcriptional regulator
MVQVEDRVYGWDMTSTWQPAKESAAVLDLSRSLASVADFKKELLAWIDRRIGYDAAFLVALPEWNGPDAPLSPLVHDGLCSTSLRHMATKLPLYESELEPVKEYALAHQGVAVDSDVLGQHRESRHYYRDLVEPHDAHSMLCYLGIRDIPVGLIMLGRGPRGFSDSCLGHLRELQPILSLALGSYFLRQPRQQAAPVLAALSPRQRELGQYLRLGYTNREIAAALGTSPNTVRNQLAALFSKMGASTRAELVGLWPA